MYIFKYCLQLPLNIQTFTECPLQKHICLRTSDPLCWHFLSDRKPNQEVTGSWCLVSLPSFPLCMCRLPHSWRQVLAGLGQLLKYLYSLIESRCSQSHACTLTRALWQCLGSLPIALSSVVCYQVETGRGKYLLWNFFRYLKPKVLLPGFVLTFMDKVDCWFFFMMAL